MMQASGGRQDRRRRAWVGIGMLAACVLAGPVLVPASALAQAQGPEGSPLQVIPPRHHRPIPPRTPYQPSGPWSLRLADLVTQVGRTFNVDCPGPVPGGYVAGGVWGTDLYTSDSVICLAAVHAGRIRADRGGRVRLQIWPGAPGYKGSNRNGVTTAAWGAYQSSFSFNVLGHVPTFADVARLFPVDPWTVAANVYTGQHGQVFTHVCPAGGRPQGSVWGSDLYTTDSNLCAAAVHAGVVTPDTGGKVTFQLLPGTSAYAGTSRNGVQTSPWGAYQASFSFQLGSAGMALVLNPPPPPPPPKARPAAAWSRNASAHAGQVGATVAYDCPPFDSYSGSAGAVWGTDVYTADSAVCVAAVHAGRIAFTAGGRVSIVMVDGKSSYAGSTRGGVTTQSWGPYQSAFTFNP
jgi:hypothetical protein